MKRFILLCIMFSTCVSVFSQATDIVVDCQTPGWLSNMISYGDQQTVQNLKVNGHINRTDLNFIGSLTQLRLNGVLDLSDVNIVGGRWDGAFATLTKSWYSDYDYHLKKIILPKNLAHYLEHEGTNNTEVDTLVFDTQVTKIAVNRLSEYSGNKDPTLKRKIGHLVIGEKVDTIETIGRAKSVHFPKSLRYLGDLACGQKVNDDNEIDYSGWIMSDFPKLEYMGYRALVPGYVDEVPNVKKETLPDSLFFSRVKQFCMSCMDYKEGMHIFFGDELNELSKDDGIAYSKSWHAAIKNVSFHIKRIPEMGGFFGCDNSVKIYVPKGTRQTWIDAGYNKNYTIFEEPNNLKSIDLNKRKISLEVNETAQLLANPNPSDADDITIIWSSDDTQVATVNETGLVRAISSGVANIIAMSADRLVRDTCKVTVKAAHSLSIKAMGGGAARFNGNTIRGGSNVFSVSEGSSATIVFVPDNGNRIKSVRLNGSDVTANVSNSQYTVSDITADTTLEVEFEVITYTLSIKASGNGTASFNNTTVRDKTTTFTVNHGSSAVVTFAPDADYRIKTVKVNNKEVTDKVFNNQYTISNITADMSLEVEFEAIPPTTYSLTIKAIGNGSATYNGTTIRSKSSSFTVNEGTFAVVSFAPDEGYRIKCVKVDKTDVTANLFNNQYTISDITSDTTLEVEFEVITYTLSIKATGNGIADYNNTVVRGKTTTFTVNHGSSATIVLSPDNGNRIKSVRLNGSDVTANVSNSQYTVSDITADTTLEVEFEVITYTLSIKASGNGTASFNNTTVRDKTTTFTVNHGSSAVVTFAPDADYRIKTVKVNNKEVTDKVFNNQYTISNITADMSLEVEFEAIPPTTYSLTIKAIGNGSATYNGTTIRSKSSSFTVNEGDLAVVSFTPDEGYRIKSVKVNNVDVTANLSESKYAINNITTDTSLEVEFEEIPPTYYSVNIIASGNGSVSYNGTSIRNQSRNFSILEGTSMNLSLSPDNGYRIQEVKVNSTDVTAQVKEGQLTISEITTETKVEVSFEAIPPTTYTLTIAAKGNGVASYEGITIRDNNQSFTVVEGTYCTILVSPDENHRVKSVKMNTEDMTRFVVNNQYVINKILSNTLLEVEFEEDITDLAHEGINYTVASNEDRTVMLAKGDYGQVLTVPASFTEAGKAWKVIGVEVNALTDNTNLAAIIWNADAAFNGSVNNPNLLLYVKEIEYASSDITNVIVGSTAEAITLTDAANGNDFYCPKAFTANRITYEHNYCMRSGYNTCQGWETIVLPFDVTQILRQSETELVPYKAWTAGNSKRPFWLYSLTELGWRAETVIAANTPYLIGMPNNENYEQSYNVSGNIQFIGINVQVKASENLITGKNEDKTLVPNYQNLARDANVYALNVNNQWSRNTVSEVEGSAFVSSLRAVHPFEAYLIVEGAAAAKRVIPIFDESITGIQESSGVSSLATRSQPAIYDLSGRRIVNGKAERRRLPRGVYVVGGRKVVVSVVTDDCR